MTTLHPSSRVRSIARLLRVVASVLALLVAATAAGALFASQQLADFMSEGPGARLLGVEEMQRRQVIGSAVLVSGAVIAGGLLLARRSPLGWPLAFLAGLVGAAFAPPLFTPAVALLGLAGVAAWVEAQSDTRLAALAPRQHPLAWAAGGVAGVVGLVAVGVLTFWLAAPLIDPGNELDEGLGFELASNSAAQATATAMPASASSTPAAATAVSGGVGAATPAASGTVASVPTPPTAPIAPTAPTAGATVTATPKATTVATPPTAVAGVGQLLARGMLKGTDSFHHGSGTVSLVRSPDGKHLLRFEDYAVQNGPDLFVYLTPDANGEPKAPGSVNLGMVRATRGSLNYEVPAGTDVSAFKSAVIWCRQFDVIFAVAKFE